MSTKPLSGSDVRRKFLDFFISKGHREMHSSSLVPANDPTLLFTNAGMNQFKDVFLGLETRDYVRATTSQKCVRAGGKHNDLENVGFTNRHHTFFEMLGNFSFGDYFKDKAIAYAWELITSPEWFGIPQDRLYITIFEGTDAIPADEEADALWQAQGVSADRIFRMGMKDNFWQMGDTGPCGPCSEIHYDMGVAASDKIRPECAASECKFPCECGRYVEIWNLVFMQFNQYCQFQRGTNPVHLDDADKVMHDAGYVDSEGEFHPPHSVPGYPCLKKESLPKPSIDTGAGLERLAAVMLNLQDASKVSNYDTDLFVPLITKAAELCGTSLEKELAKEAGSKSAASLRVIADHARAATFLIGDGVIPANEGRGYVLRKIIRRGIYHSTKLCAPGLVMTPMAQAVSDSMSQAYPELPSLIPRIQSILEREEQTFSHTFNAASGQFDEALQEVFDASDKLDQGQSAFVADASQIGKAKRSNRAGEAWEGKADSGTSELIFPGDKAFKLYDTFGLPLDFMIQTCRDAGFTFDQAGFDAAMSEQKNRARASWKGAAKQTANPSYQNLPHSTFEGYTRTELRECEVFAILSNGQGAPELAVGAEGEVILDHTPFYADSGGQVGDHGWLRDSSGSVIAEVTGTYSPVQGVRAHKVIARQPIRIGDKLDAIVDTDLRHAAMRHHTATHLLHAALRETLGTHVKQAGSLVAPGHLRFDFSHFAGVADEELQDIEDTINREVLSNIAVQTLVDVPIDQAISEYHAMALFGEKYGDKVRVVKIGDFSTELCGGTHTAATGEIGLIKILSEGSVSSGVRRIEAVAGDRSLEHFRRDHALEKLVSGMVGRTDHASPSDALRAEFDKKEAEIKRLTRELDQVRMKSAASSVASVDDKIREVKGVKVLAHRVDGLDSGQMRTLVDQLKLKLVSGVAVLGSVQGDDKVAITVGVTKDLAGRIQAGKVIAPIAQKVGGTGGGKPEMAMAGGKDIAALDAALAAAYDVVGDLLG